MTLTETRAVWLAAWHWLDRHGARGARDHVGYHLRLSPVPMDGALAIPAGRNLYDHLCAALNAVDPPALAKTA